MSDANEIAHDFIIIGSGAGGGPLAANLAESGFRVLLLEAGSDHRCPYYDVPIMQAHASQDAKLRWDFFVRHYQDDAQQRRDSKFVADKGGVLYPRGASIGGSSVLNALVTVYPHNSDWDGLAELTGDPDWGADPMRKRFQRIEAWRGPDPDPEDPARPGDERRHGFDGWLGTSRAKPKLAGREPWFLDIIAAIEAESRERYNTPENVLLPNDPNDWRFVSERREGMSMIPAAIHDGQRNSVRERLLDTQRRLPHLLEIRQHCLATRVLFDGLRAVGVEYLFGDNLYAADPNSDQAHGPGEIHQAFASREVILAGGAYNTPQLLKLSGIGPRDELQAHGIDVLLDRPGVGANLQDRYEIAVTHRLKHDYPVFDGAALDVPGRDNKADRHFIEWRDKRDGPYSTNGSLAAFIAKSSVAGLEPDLFIFALPVEFHGYYPGYARDAIPHHDRLSILVLKAHTENRAGSVTLRSADPRDVPQIDFRYFDEGSAGWQDDLTAVAEGVGIARRIAARLGETVAEELLPGKDADVEQFIRDEAWGHHASCTCKIGTDDDPMAVLDGDFRVRGTEGLRVVDASVFPRIPGFFIISAVYMVAERASDVIIAEHGPQT